MRCCRHFAFSVLLVAVAVPFGAMASQTKTVELITREQVNRSYNDYDPSQSAPELANTWDQTHGRPKVLNGRAELTVPVKGDVEFSQFCHGYHFNQTAPFQYDVAEPMGYQDFLLSSGFDASSADLNPLTYAPHIQEIIEAAEFQFTYRSQLSGLSGFIHVRGNDVVCWTYLDDPGLYKHFYSFYRYEIASRDGTDKDFWTILCRQPGEERKDLPETDICYERPSEAEKDDPAQSGSSPNSQQSDSGSGLGSGAGNGSGSGVLGNSTASFEEQVTALLKSGVIRTTEIELLLCAVAHPECRLAVNAADTLRFLSLADLAVARNRLLELLSA